MNADWDIHVRIYYTLSPLAAAIAGAVVRGVFRGGYPRGPDPTPPNIFFRFEVHSFRYVVIYAVSMYLYLEMYISMFF